MYDYRRMEAMDGSQLKIVDSSMKSTSMLSLRFPYLSVYLLSVMASVVGILFITYSGMHLNQVDFTSPSFNNMHKMMCLVFSRISRIFVVISVIRHVTKLL